MIPQTHLNRLVRDTSKEIGGLVDSLLSGETPATEFSHAMASMLEDAHAEAARLGRLRAGDTLTALEDDDRTFGQLVVDSESEFLDRFAVAIMRGQYTKEDGTLDRDAIERRSQSYTGRLTGTANETFTLTSDDNAQFYWRLGGIEEHCPDCPEIAAGSPYYTLDLPTHPRSNGTACLFNCKCYLERDDNVTGFQPV